MVDDVVVDSVAQILNEVVAEVNILAVKRKLNGIIFSVYNLNNFIFVSGINEINVIEIESAEGISADGEVISGS